MGIKHLARHDDDKHLRLIHQLREAGRPQDRRLANILARCPDERACRSAACIHCGRDFQRVALDLVEQEIRGPARRNLRCRMTAITLVPTEGCLAPSDLTAAACRDVTAKVKAALDACGISPGMLGLDISFNEDTTGNVEPHWCAHGHDTSLDWLTGEQADALAEHFPKSRLVPRPTHVMQLDSKDDGPLYAFKPDRARRVSFINSGNPNRSPYRDTKPRALRPDQAVQLAHVEHELGFEFRLIPHGIDESAFEAAIDAFYRARDGP